MASPRQRNGRRYSDPFSPGSSQNNQLPFLPPISTSPSTSTSASMSPSNSSLAASGSMALTQESLSRLQIADNWPSTPTSASSSRDRIRERDRGVGGNATGGRSKWPFMRSSTVTTVKRVASATPSITSISDEEQEEDQELSVRIDKEDVKDWLRRGKSVKGKEKAQELELDRERASDPGKIGLGQDRNVNTMAENLPPEILIQIFRLLPDNRDLLSSLLVSRTWCLCAFSLIWHKPHLPTARHLGALVRVISSAKPFLPYSQAIRRLYLTQLAPTLSDELLLGVSHCSRVERLNLTGAVDVSPESLIQVFKGMPELTSVDLNNVMAVNDEVVAALANHCGKLQALNLTKCKLVGDEGVRQVAKCNKLLRRIKLVDCHRVTDASLISLVQSCTLLLEIDLTDVLALSNATTYSMFLHASCVREIRLNDCALLTEDCIPNLPDLSEMSEDDLVRSAQAVGLVPKKGRGAGAWEDLRIVRPVTDMFDCLRVVDMTGCEKLGDKAVENLITNAPKIRTLTLAKCGNLTNASLDSICKLGKHLHYLHLGHLRNLTDEGVIRLARACSRLRYIDLACCELLTDASVFEIGANMPKLRRIGLVKVTNITDEAIYALVERFGSLERIHLSYCDKLSVKAITFLLNRLLHLKHLSLTGVSAFKNAELQSFCRAAPSNFNSHQRAAFCVYSGDRVTQLRHHLNLQLASAGLESDSTSTRRGSGSSTSSITLPGAPSPPPHLPGFLPSYTHPHHHTHAAHETNYVYRRGSAPSLRNTPLPGLPANVFATPSPNFLNPAIATVPPSQSTASSHSTTYVRDSAGHYHPTQPFQQPSSRSAYAYRSVANGNASPWQPYHGQSSHSNPSPHASTSQRQATTFSSYSLSGRATRGSDYVESSERDRERPGGPRARSSANTSNH